MEVDADFIDPMAVHLLHRETQVVRSEDVAFARKVAFEFEHQPGKGFGLAPDVGENVLADVEDTLEIPEVGLSLENIALGVEPRVEALVVVALVGNLADLLFDAVC